ncbi:MAG: F0F1 ATP synthase subunit epsilon [Halobacteria archaeon]|nr:F0F1 ATP synthase subunit epsilon [Halobacteria archaeon]
MAMTMHIDIVSAEAEIFSGTVEVVVAPAIMGEVGIYPRHTQMLTPLKPGEVRVTKLGGEEESFYVSGGVMEVQPHCVTVLSDTCVRAHDLDEAAVLEAKKAAEQSIKDRDSEMELAEAQAKLAEAVAQLQAIQRMKKTNR